MYQEIQCTKEVFQARQDEALAKLAEIRASAGAKDYYILWYPEYRLCVRKYDPETVKGEYAGGRALCNTSPINAHTFAWEWQAREAQAKYQFSNGKGEHPEPVLLSVALEATIRGLQELIDHFDAV